MDTGQPCYIDYEGQRHEAFLALQRKALQVADNDKLFEEEKEKVNKIVITNNEFISHFEQHYGDVFYMAASIRRERDFFNKHGRSETISEFLLGIK